MTKLERNLTENSIEAFILALEIINKLSISYRMESFVFLFCNAWELLLKAKLLKEKQKIFYPKKRNQPLRSLSLNDCLNRVFTSTNDPVRLNIEKIKELRDNATHLIIPLIPAEAMALFQAGVINYTNKLTDWLGKDISQRVPLGMMTLVYDIDPSLHALDAPVIRKRLPADTLRWWKLFQKSVRGKAQSIATERDAFYIPIDLKLALVKNPNKANIVLSSGTGGENAIFVETPKSPDATHPYRQKEVILQVNERLDGRKTVNSYDILCVRKVFKIDPKNNPKFCYKSQYSPLQYSNAFIHWLVEQFDKNPESFDRARQKYRNSTHS